ncbi:MAG TPA: XRE family transcriptional regulator [Chloroflexota bacterium]|nr:XRE family transcriptional regulator [Chloroflexota bacterium]
MAANDDLERGGVVAENQEPESDGDPNDEFEIGPRLRQIRRDRSLTMAELAARSGLTRSFLSQVESGRVSPSLTSLQKIASALGMTLGAMFAVPSPHSRVVRREDRSRLRYSKSNVEDELLSPTLTGKLEVLSCTIGPHEVSGDEPYAHNADEECVVVLAGLLEIVVDGDRYLLREGDAITFCSREPHWWCNPADADTRCLWVITPPGF